LNAVDKDRFSADQFESFLRQVLNAVDQEGGIIKNNQLLYATDYLKNDIDFNKLMVLFEEHAEKEQSVSYRSRRVFCEVKHVPLNEHYRLLLLNKMEEKDLMSDPLTGVLNRESFDHLSGFLLKESKKLNKIMAFLFIDLDDFKLVNDTWGHESGDRVLKTVAGRISDIIRDDDFCFRIGGDEFVVILTSVRYKMHSCLVARRLIYAVSQPIDVNAEKDQVEIGISIGIATYPADGYELETLVHKADELMYQAKKLGGNSYQMHMDTGRNDGNGKRDR
jgi:diguanylate cyclase (GGDEF)-like protein